jgi:hypothetical protein
MSFCPSLPVRPAACTIISRNYLSLARVLAASYMEHHPEARFYVLVIDGLPSSIGVVPGARLLGPEDLALGSFRELAFAYDIAELCTAVKPSLLSLLLDRFNEDAVVYLDPDIWVLRPLDELHAALTEANIVITPHLLRPLPRDGRRPTDQDILLAGAYNLGVLGLRRGGQVGEFLRWWRDHLLNGGAIVQVAAGLMTDQRWVDLVPSLFPETTVLRDETYNVAWWNLPHRMLSRSGDRFEVNGRRLGCFHFSGFNPSDRQRLTRENQNRIAVARGSTLTELLALYADRALQAGYAETNSWPCGYTRFDTGVRINLPLRRLYLSLDNGERKRFGDPFRARTSDSFLEWARRPSSADASLSPFLRSLYQLRHDLRNSFPDIKRNVRDRDGFLEWARTNGARELKYDPDEMRVTAR